jgi:hypothetical protein
MATNLFEPPPVYDLPLVRGQDLVVDFKKREGDQYVPYDSDESVQLVIEANPTIIAEAIINEHHALCRIESEITDPLKARLDWRCVVTQAGSPSTEVVACNGQTIRYDR